MDFLIWDRFPTNFSFGFVIWHHPLFTTQNRLKPLNPLKQNKKSLKSLRNMNFLNCLSSIMMTFARNRLTVHLAFSRKRINSPKMPHGISPPQTPHPPHPKVIYESPQAHPGKTMNKLSFSFWFPDKSQNFEFPQKR